MVWSILGAGAEFGPNLTKKMFANLPNVAHKTIDVRISASAPYNIIRSQTLKMQSFGSQPANNVRNHCSTKAFINGGSYSAPKVHIMKVGTKFDTS